MRDIGPPSLTDGRRGTDRPQVLGHVREFLTEAVLADA
ncbi:hypothetical protein FHS32_004171 [Streptomyces albaduncus]|uniref:Uncharacterized protein n=1 Tax=Streptomyces griseoloalbus TaxID=67303 RepID=A0A7W8BSQ4_9ACTN|nr:hypothetical protein [Streptomyces albaduncus]